MFSNVVGYLVVKKTLIEGGEKDGIQNLIEKMFLSSGETGKQK